MLKSNINTPEGTRDLLYADCLIHRRTQAILTQVFSSHGYSEIATPAIEYYDTFLRAGNAIPQESMLKTIDRSGKITVMRPDCTTPIARVTATHLRKETLPCRLYYNETVFRSTAANIGHNSEIDQCGVELIGAAGLRADAEIVALALEALSSCGLSNFRIELGHAAFFKALAEELQTDAETCEEIRSLVEQKSFAALDDLLSESFSDRPSYRALKHLSRLFGSIEVLDEAEQLTQNKQALTALHELRTVYEDLTAAGYGDRIGFDLGLVQQLDYYTGLVFCGYVEGTGHTAVNGGRYDNLMGEFGRPAPATGFAVDVDGIARAMEQPERAAVKKLIHYDTDCLAAAMALQKAAAPGAVELSACDTIEESRALAKEKHIPLLLHLNAAGSTEEKI